MRIVSLLASATELACALDLESNLVGISHECDEPASVCQLPRLSRPRFSPDVSSKLVDSKVKDLLSKALSIFEVDLDRILELRPTHILTQDQCEVCAVNFNDLTGLVSRSAGSSVEIVSLRPDSLENIYLDIMKLGEIFDRIPRAKDLCSRIKNQLQKTRARAQIKNFKPKVLSIEWVEPLMASGNWMPELIEIAGGQNLFGEAGRHSKVMSWDSVIQVNPDLILISPCGYSLERAKQEIKILENLSFWKELQAVQSGQVFFADGNRYFHRPGPRLPDYAELLFQMFHGPKGTSGVASVWSRINF